MSSHIVCASTVVSLSNTRCRTHSVTRSRVVSSLAVAPSGQLPSQKCLLEKKINVSQFFSFLRSFVPTSRHAVCPPGHFPKWLQWKFVNQLTHFLLPILYICVNTKHQSIDSILLNIFIYRNTFPKCFNKCWSTSLGKPSIPPSFCFVILGPCCCCCPFCCLDFGPLVIVFLL